MCGLAVGGPTAFSGSSKSLKTNAGPRKRGLPRAQLSQAWPCNSHSGRWVGARYLLVETSLPRLWKSLAMGGDVEVSVLGQQDLGGGDHWV